VFLTACTVATPPEPAPVTLPATTPAPTQTLPPTATDPVVPAKPTATPNYLYSEANSFEAELNQIFALRNGQTVYLPSEDLTISHITDIEFECPENAECEVPLIATDKFKVTQGGKPLGYKPWEPVLEFGDYLLTTARFYSGYNYHEHRFEIVLAVEHRDAVIAREQTRQAQAPLAKISSNCGSTPSQFIAVHPETPEVHMIGIYESSPGLVEIHLERTAAPLILILSAHKSTTWNLHLAKGVSLQKIILNGANPQTVVGADGVSVIDRSGPGNNIVGGVYVWRASDLGYQNGVAPAWIYQMESVAGTPLNTFTGCYKASKFIIQ